MTTFTPFYKQVPNSQCSQYFSTSPPPGSIIAYFGGGNTPGYDDPDGWVIADGVGRSSSDGRYNYIANELNIGTIVNNIYTPPDLRGAFLRGGKRGATTSYGSYAGNVKASQTPATKVHNHLITDPGHGHPFHIFNDDFNNIGAGNNRFGVSSAAAVQVRDTNISNWGFNPGEAVMNNVTGITIASSTDDVHSDETRPYNFSVNWIIKY